MLKIIGKKCQYYRQSKGYTQYHVATETNYSVEAISKFENGRSNNLKIFMWYIKDGMLIGGILNEIN